jgi:hypothetical protein
MSALIANHNFIETESGKSTKAEEKRRKELFNGCRFPVSKMKSSALLHSNADTLGSTEL